MYVITTNTKTCFNPALSSPSPISPAINPLTVPFIRLNVWNSELNVGVTEVRYVHFGKYLDEV